MLTNKNILISGGMGFIGCQLANSLCHNNTVYVIDNFLFPSTRKLDPKINFLCLDAFEIYKLVDIQFDLMFHFGEYSRVEQSVEDIDLVLDNNLSRIPKLLKFVRTNVKKLVYSGSSTKFTHDPEGIFQSPYAYTKAINSQTVKYYCETQNIEYAIVYFYNVYGPGETSTGKYATVVAKFAEKMRRKEALTIVSPGTQVRCFTHIYDVIRGLTAVAEHGKGDNYGIGNSHSISILELAELFGGPIEWLPARAGNRHNASLITSKTTDLGWSAELEIYDYVRSLKAKDWNIDE